MLLSFQFNALQNDQQNRNVYKRVVAYDVGCRKTFPYICVPFRSGEFICDVSARDCVRVEVRANKHSTECMCINFRSKDFPPAYSLFDVYTVCSVWQTGTGCTRCQVTVIQFCWHTRRKSDKYPRRKVNSIDERNDERRAAQRVWAKQWLCARCSLHRHKHWIESKWQSAPCNAVFVKLICVKVRTSYTFVFVYIILFNK